MMLKPFLSEDILAYSYSLICSVFIFLRASEAINAHYTWFLIFDLRTDLSFSDYSSNDIPISSEFSPSALSVDWFVEFLFIRAILAGMGIFIYSNNSIMANPFLIYALVSSGYFNNSTSVKVFESLRT